MKTDNIQIVTGAFGFSGKYIARRLLDTGHRVHTITNSIKRANTFKGALLAFPYNFDNHEKLVEALKGTDVLYNNYWVRFNHKDFTHSKAVENSHILFNAAKKAGIRRIVHISITNPSENSSFEYFRGKAEIERILIESGLSYAILRPAVIFGQEDILINNIAWFLRRFPLFGVFGNGNYRLQPIHVEDLANLAVEQGQKTENCIIDAIGPETFTYRSLVEEIGKAIGKQRKIISITPSAGYCLGSLIGRMLGDITITRDEIEGLMSDLLYTNSAPQGKIKLTDWLKEYSATVGRRYSNELARRRDTKLPYNHLQEPEEKIQWKLTYKGIK
ncbi:MAG: epimerase [Nitrospirae bacterium GWC2_42_7]|nr:MAG: epimerase [Nitrospirae bacterium GWC2_42_7]